MTISVENLLNVRADMLGLVTDLSSLLRAIDFSPVEEIIIWNNTLLGLIPLADKEGKSMLAMIKALTIGQTVRI